MEQVKDDKKLSFESVFKAKVIDTIVMIIISLAVLLILDGVILRLLGYKIVKEYMGTALLTIFILASAIYPTFMECRKGRTYEKKLSQVEVKREDSSEDKDLDTEKVDTMNTEKVEEVEIKKDVEVKEETNIEAIDNEPIHKDDK